VTDESWLDEQIKSMGGNPKKLVASATIKKTFDGTVSVVLDDGKKFKDAGWKFFWRGDFSIDSLFFQISQGVGWASRKHRYMMGNNAAGWSPGYDVTSGGATGAFFRIAAKGSVVTSKAGIIMHPRVFQRTDWWRYNSDNYGTIATGGPGVTDNSKQRYDTEVTSAHTSNEICFQNGVSLDDVMAVTVKTNSDKNKLIHMLEAEGITEVNGVSLDKFILSVGGTALSDTIWDMLPPELRPSDED